MYRLRSNMLGMSREGRKRRKEKERNAFYSNGWKLVMGWDPYNTTCSCIPQVSVPQEQKEGRRQVVRRGQTAGDSEMERERETAWDRKEKESTFPDS